ncbi:hypothetical protein [Holospora curviuscula]|uniref:Putative Peptidoglycan domain protein n=1 Tax=Holospora curviuscula TaxID=1082868 RepID=A0A2S5R7Q8_9PROT|nr:hypothetical protein [Holospora curviuscula]PPE03354.1 putative Peptidoglycan domain protein [Holospora curviuscula]
MKKIHKKALFIVLGGLFLQTVPAYSDPKSIGTTSYHILNTSPAQYMQGDSFRLIEKFLRKRDASKYQTQVANAMTVAVGHCQGLVYVWYLEEILNPLQKNFTQFIQCIDSLSKGELLSPEQAQRFDSTLQKVLFSQNFQLRSLVQRKDKFDSRGAPVQHLEGFCIVDPKNSYIPQLNVLDFFLEEGIACKAPRTLSLDVFSTLHTKEILNEIHEALSLSDPAQKEKLQKLNDTLTYPEPCYKKELKKVQEMFQSSEYPSKKTLVDILKDARYYTEPCDQANLERILNTLSDPSLESKEPIKEQIRYARFLSSTPIKKIKLYEVLTAMYDSTSNWKDNVKTLIEEELFRLEQNQQKFNTMVHKMREMLAAPELMVYDVLRKEVESYCLEQKEFFEFNDIDIKQCSQEYRTMFSLLDEPNPTQKKEIKRHIDEFYVFIKSMQSTYIKPTLKRELKKVFQKSFQELNMDFMNLDENWKKIFRFFNHTDFYHPISKKEIKKLLEKLDKQEYAQDSVVRRMCQDVFFRSDDFRQKNIFNAILAPFSKEKEECNDCLLDYATNVLFEEMETSIGEAEEKLKIVLEKALQLPQSATEKEHLQHKLKLLEKILQSPELKTEFCRELSKTLYEDVQTLYEDVPINRDALKKSMEEYLETPNWKKPLQEALENASVTPDLFPRLQINKMLAVLDESGYQEKLKEILETTLSYQNPSYPKPLKHQIQEALTSSDLTSLSSLREMLDKAIHASALNKEKIKTLFAEMLNHPKHKFLNVALRGSEGGHTVGIYGKIGDILFYDPNYIIEKVEDLDTLTDRIIRAGECLVSKEILHEDISPFSLSIEIQNFYCLSEETGYYSGPHTYDAQNKENFHTQIVKCVGSLEKNDRALFQRFRASRLNSLSLDTENVFSVTRLPRVDSKYRVEIKDNVLGTYDNALDASNAVLEKITDTDTVYYVLTVQENESLEQKEIS